MSTRIGQNATTKRQRIMQHAAECGWTFTWTQDDDPDLSWMTPEELAEPHEVLGCVLRDRRGHVLASLWGIVDADHAYGQQVEAELATEARCDIRVALLAGL